MSCDQVKRETILDVDADRAWEAISDPDWLERWLADDVDLELVEGSDATFTVDGDERPGRVERVEEGRGLSFTWEREAGRPSLVELELTPCVSGIRIEVTETDLGAGPTMSAAGWTSRLSSLRSQFVLVAA
jgi:uncharacterized protein YndB with AHSA1/START domain